MTSTWQMVVGIVGPILTFLGAIIVAIIAPMLGRRAANQTAAANTDNARAALQNAATAAAKQQDEHWARYTDALQRRLEDQDGHISANTQRIEDAELRSEAAEVRAGKAEHLYSISMVYLRRVIRWINDNLPGEDYPPPPPELNLEL